MASVRDRAVIGKHDTIGRGYLFLDPKRFGDYLAHEVWLDLDTAGRILLRVSMEGEKDDPQFFFGRAFRSLKRAESDMIRVIIDKVRKENFSITLALTRSFIGRTSVASIRQSRCPLRTREVHYDVLRLQQSPCRNDRIIQVRNRRR